MILVSFLAASLIVLLLFIKQNLQRPTNYPPGKIIKFVMSSIYMSYVQRSTRSRSKESAKRIGRDLRKLFASFIAPGQVIFWI